MPEVVQTTTTTTPPAGNPPPENKELEKLQLQLDAEKKEKSKLASDLQKLSSELDGLKKSGMKGSEDWKKLAETFEGENKTLKERAESIEKKMKDTFRVMHVKQEALKLGLRPESVTDVEFMDMGDLEVIEKDSGTYEVKGADRWAQDLKKVRAHWFKQPTAPNVNGAGGGEGAPEIKGEITEKQFQEAFRNRVKDPKTWATVNAAYNKQKLEQRKAK